MERNPTQYQQLLKELRPLNYGSFNVEPFELYKERAKRLLPKWPECPLENWLHRHYDFFIDDYGWLRFDKMVFTMESWHKERIYIQIRTHKLEIVDGLGKQIFTKSPSMRSGLQEYFINKGTWPTPIIILENTIGIVGIRNERYGQPYHLLEGHLRLGYFRNFFCKNQDNLKEIHSVWVVTLAEKA